MPHSRADIALACSHLFDVTPWFLGGQAWEVWYFIQKVFAVDSIAYTLVNIYSHTSVGKWPDRTRNIQRLIYMAKKLA